MAGRPGVVVTVDKDADGGVSPNRFVPQISAHIRLYWPPRATIEEVTEALLQAYRETLEAVNAHEYKPY